MGINRQSREVSPLNLGYFTVEWKLIMVKHKREQISFKLHISGEVNPTFVEDFPRYMAKLLYTKHDTISVSVCADDGGSGDGYTLIISAYVKYRKINFLVDYPDDFLKELKNILGTEHKHLNICFMMVEQEKHYLIKKETLTAVKTIEPEICFTEANADVGAEADAEAEADADVGAEADAEAEADADVGAKADADVGSKEATSGVKQPCIIDRITKLEMEIYNKSSEETLIQRLETLKSDWLTTESDKEGPVVNILSTLETILFGL